ncbi:MAG: PsiF family protein [Betaproteobacteria bacterium]
MKNHMLVHVLALACVPVFAQGTPQQEKMKLCNADAAKEQLKGDERKAFMKDCLAAKTPPKVEKKTAVPSQQEKMKKCNVDAGARKLKGDERKTFMSECLKSP